MLKEEARGSRAISGLHWLRARLHFGRSEPGMCGPASRERHSRAEDVSALPAVSIRAGAAATSGRAHLALWSVSNKTRSQTSHASALRIACISRDEMPRLLLQSAWEGNSCIGPQLPRQACTRIMAAASSSGLPASCCFSSEAGTLQLLPVREATSRRRRRSTNHNNANDGEQRRDGRTRNES